ncbi:MAG TPA: hypothetical protein VEA59_02665 [Patescibacteria group bacterium]|nr:hypothetical protein [Patescibacteria group bacterium]
MNLLEASSKLNDKAFSNRIALEFRQDMQGFMDRATQAYSASELRVFMDVLGSQHFVIEDGARWLLGIFFQIGEKEVLVREWIKTTLTSMTPSFVQGIIHAYAQEEDFTIAAAMLLQTRVKGLGDAMVGMSVFAGDEFLYGAAIMFEVLRRWDLQDSKT